MFLKGIKRSNLLIAACCMALVTAQQYANAANKVLVIIKPSLYGQIKSKVDRYIADIPYAAQLCQIDPQSPEALKTYIINNKQDLLGCVLIGNFNSQIARFHNPKMDNDKRCDLFLMDLDGRWQDTNSDGIYDLHTDGNGTIEPEIFIAHIDVSPFIERDSEINLLSRYFDKDHKYWSGELTLHKKVLEYFEWGFNGKQISQFEDLYDHLSFEVVNDTAILSKADYSKRLRDNSFDFVGFTNFHSNEQFHAFSDGWLTSREIFDFQPQAVGFFLGTCLANDYSSNFNLGGAYIYSNSNRSLVVVGDANAGNSESYNDFCLSLHANEPIGTAFLKRQREGMYLLKTILYRILWGMSISGAFKEIHLSPFRATNLPCIFGLM